MYPLDKSILSNSIKTYLEKTKDIIFFKDCNLNIIACSKAFQKLCNQPLANILGKTVFELFPLELATKYHQDDLTVIRTEEPLIDAIELIALDQDHTRYGSTSKYPIKNNSGDIIGVCGISYDITAKIELEEEKERSLFSSLLFENIFEADITLDKLLRIKGSIFETISSDLRQHTFIQSIHNLAKNLISPQYKTHFISTFSPENLMEMYESGIHEFEHVTYMAYNDQPNTCVLFMCRLYRSTLSNSLKLIICLKNSLDEFALGNNLRMLMGTDELTGVFNRRGFYDEVALHLKTSPDQTYALLFVDIDYFKQVNDTYGHATGDEILKISAKALQDAFRHKGFIGRIGGDEFLVFVENATDSDMLKTELLQIFSHLQRFWTTHQYLTTISYSIGVAISSPGISYADLAAEADSAMYQAKQKGRNCICFHEPDTIPATPVPLNGPQWQSDMIYLLEHYGRTFDELALLCPNNDYTYIIDVDTYELLSFEAKDPETQPPSTKDYCGKKCYEVLENRSEPCPFCTTPVLSRDKFHIWKHFNTFFNKDFLFKELLIDWKGHTARLNIGTDISNKERSQALLLESLRTQNILFDCIDRLFIDADLPKALNQSIPHICNFFDADAGYIQLWEGVNTLAKWSNHSMDLAALSTKSTCVDHLTYWHKHMYHITQIYIPDIEACQIDPNFKTLWQSAGIHNLVAVPIFSTTDIFGVLVLFNIKESTCDLTHLNVYCNSLAKNLETVKAQRSVHHLQIYDPLTTAYNFEGFRTKTKHLVNYQTTRKFALINCDVAFFKNINEKYGYALGDHLLCHIATCAKRDGTQEEIIGRIGADNFCFLWKYEDEESLNEDYLKLKQQVAIFAQEHYLHEDIDLIAGVYLLTSDEDITIAIERAGKARKMAKTLCCNQLFYFSDSIEQQFVREHSILQHFKPALENQEIKIYFQPQYEYSTGHLVGAEVLARWESPVLGQVFPSEFIPLLENHGKIYELDKYIWDMTCHQIRIWQDKLGKSAVPPISVNLSRQDVQHPDLCHVLCTLLAKYQLHASVLKLEVTETAYLSDQTGLIALVNQLKSIGFQCLLDDFGSGYSSLNTLNDLPIDVLKLDMSLVQGSEDSERSGNILSSVVRMAHWLNLPVIAEGVETVLQADFLKNIGCDIMQGYFFSKPLPVDAFEEILRQSKPVSKASRKKKLLNTTAAKEFLDPHSKSAQLFERIGPASIIEYAAGNIETLVINESYLDLLGFTPSEYAKWMPHCQKRLTKSTREAYEKAFKQLIYGDTTLCEITVPLQTKSQKVITTKSAIRLIACDDDKYIFLILSEDITEDEFTSPRVLAADIFQQLYTETTDISHLQTALAHIGKQLNLSRVYIFENSDDNLYTSNTFEWCNQGITEEIHNLQNVHLPSLGGYYELNFGNTGIFYCEDITTLPEPQHSILEAQGVKSLLQYGLKKNGIYRGFIGFDNCNDTCIWSQSHVDAMIRTAQILAMFLDAHRKSQ